VNIVGYVFVGLITLTPAGAPVAVVRPFPDIHRNVRMRLTSLP
jgi:hypothetical protein